MVQHVWKKVQQAAQGGEGIRQQPRREYVPFSGRHNRADGERRTNSNVRCASGR